MAGTALVALPSVGGVQPPIRLTPQYGAKYAVAITLFGAGMHYLVSGRKQADLSRMITGAVLALASLLFI